MNRSASAYVAMIMLVAAAHAAAVTDVLFPEQDVTTQWSVKVGPEHWEDVNEDEGSLTTTDNIYTSTAGVVDEFEFETVGLSWGHEVIRVEVAAYGAAAAGSGVYANIDMGGWQVEEPLGFTSVESWQSAYWEGTWGQSDVDDLLVRVTSGGADDHVNVSALYVRIFSYRGIDSLFLDVGNDTDYDWTAPVDFTGPERLDLTGYLKHYVNNGCWCIGCIHDSATGNCTVPVVLTSDHAGNLTVDDVDLEYLLVRTVGEVSYGDSYRAGEGGCWVIQTGIAPVTYTGSVGIPIPPGYEGDCDSSWHQYITSDHVPPNSDDAIDHAVYRLLNETLDANRNGIIEEVGYNENMTFDAEGKIGVQTLWGPVRMRLVVWT